jgi:hypothetical protein
LLRSDSISRSERCAAPRALLREFLYLAQAAFTQQ